MDVFVLKYQPDRYKLWKAGKDNTAIDHSKPTPEAAKFLQDNKSQSPAEDEPEVTSSTQEEKRSLHFRTILYFFINWHVGSHIVGSHFFIHLFLVLALKLRLGQNVN